MPATGFPKKDIPEFLASKKFGKGKPSAKRRQMAVAAAMEAQRKGRKGKRPTNIQKAAALRIANGK